MLDDEYTAAAPATAVCLDCRHMVPDPITGRPWCEVLAKFVKMYGWCEDYELETMRAIREGKFVEKS